MGRVVAWNCIYYDSALIHAGIYPAGGTLATYFKDDKSFDEESVTNKHERQLVDELFAEAQSRQLLFPELDLPLNSFFKTHVVEPLIEDRQRKPGDIDVLVCPSDNPNLAVAIECKRVKVIAASSVDDDVHKIKDIRDGAAQTKAMRKMGFHRTFIAVLIQVDGRKREERNTVTRGLNPQATFDGERRTLKEIYEFPQSGIFNADVGFVFIEVIQPTGKSFEKMGGICLRLEREARRIEQPSTLTNRVAALILGTQQ